MRGSNGTGEPAEPATTPRVDSATVGPPAAGRASAAELQIEPGATERIERLVSDYVRSICALDPRDAEYQRTVVTVQRLCAPQRWKGATLRWYSGSRGCHA